MIQTEVFYVARCAAVPYSWMGKVFQARKSDGWSRPSGLH